MNNIFQKYKDLIPYGIFGILTTLVNIGTYWLFAHPMNMSVMASTILAWILAIAFAYLTNRKWVFHSKASSRKEIIKEISSFFSCRIGTEVVDIVAMFIFVDLLHCNDIIVKLIANIVVIILNYLASKFVIFKQAKKAMVK